MSKEFLSSLPEVMMNWEKYFLMYGRLSEI